MKEDLRSLPAVHCNRFRVDVTSEGVRLSFGEVFSDIDVRYRSAVHLTAANALELAKLIEELVK